MDGEAPAEAPRRESPPPLFRTDFTFTGATKVEPLARDAPAPMISPVLHPVVPADPSVPVPALPQHRGLQGALRPWTRKFLRQRSASGKSDRQDGVRGRKKRILFVTDTYLPSVNGALIFCDTIIRCD